MSENKDLSRNSIYTEKHLQIIKYVCSQTNLTENQAIHGLHMCNGDYKKVIKLATIEHLINLVMRQTTYTRKEAIEKLKKYNGEPVDVIREFMGIKPKEKKQPKTTNQLVFHEIRNFMDDVNNKYNARKERNERIVKMREKLMQNQKVMDDANKKET